MKDSVKISSLVSTQLPNFISDNPDYSTFVSFMESYFEWLESNGQVFHESKKLQSYLDIDNTIDDFIDYFYGQFLPSFPKEVLSDKRKLLKFARELYHSKGTKYSYKFLFKVLYDSECQVIENKDFILKASDGAWYLPKSVKLKSTDERFLLTEQLFLFGETSKTLAKIERGVVVNGKIEIFISDVERVFNVGEIVRVVDSNFADVYFDTNGEITTSGEGDILSSQIIASISGLDIDKNYRGNYYQKGNPVVFYGGLANANSNTAIASVNEVTSGSIQRVVVDSTVANHGFTYPTTAIYVDPDPNKSTMIRMGSVDSNTLITLNYVIKDSLELKENIILNCDANSSYLNMNTSTNYSFSNSSISANANTKMSDVFNFVSLPTYSINSAVVENGGGGFSGPPKLTPSSLYIIDSYISGTYDPRYTFDQTHNLARLGDLGILGPIKIAKDPFTGKPLGGLGYEANDEIIFSGGLGTGAYARVSNVAASNGQIVSVSYYQNENTPAPIGGFGYSLNGLPEISVSPKIKTANVTSGSNLIKINSANPLWNVKVGQLITGNGIPSNTVVSYIYTGNNTVKMSNTSNGSFISNTYNFVGFGASLYVDEIMGTEAVLNPTTDNIGSITSFSIENYGEEYTSTPSVSLKIQDFVVYNISPSRMPAKGDLILSNSSASNYKAYVDSITPIQYNVNPLLTKYILRTYNYNIPFDLTTPIKLRNLYTNESNTRNLFVDKTYVFETGYYGITENKTGLVTFGDGSAKALAKFLNGLILGNGRYISDRGHPSSYCKIQDENINNYTYILSVEKEISKYRELITNILHPAGTKLIGQAVIKSKPPFERDHSYTSLGTITQTNEPFEPIYFVISTEGNVKFKSSYPNKIRWPSSVDFYATQPANSNNTLIISNISSNVQIGGILTGEGWGEDTEILDIYVSNSTILLSNSSTYTSNASIFYVNNNIIFGDSQEGSNVMFIQPEDKFSYITKNQIIFSEPFVITGNISNGKLFVTNVTNTSPILAGQSIENKALQSNTSIVYYYHSNSTIVLSKTATANSSAVRYYDRYSNSYIVVENYIKVYPLNPDTKIININKTTNIITLSNTFVGYPKSNLYTIYGNTSSIYGGDSYEELRTEYQE